ncbi:uncharacterized protein TNCV_1965181 [Trichonephila clavipes]|nr:uncharacterized protein TNCV_1965181 [Trichonephila clavipes]
MDKSRSGRSKKRRFTGNRYTIRATINENDETSELNSTESASAKKFPYDREDESSGLINSSIVLGLRIIGKGFSAGKKLCAFLGLPFLSKLAFRNQERKLLKATERVAQENINAALSEIKGSNSFTKCGISIDGTWQRRGYSSLNGCCPEGSESWCRYQRAKAAGSPLKEIEQGLPNKIINQIKPTYLKLCNETLLKNVFMIARDKYKNNKEFINDYLDSIISDRKSKEEQARVTAESRLEFEKINLAKEEQVRVTAESRLEFEKINLEKVKLEIELGKINLERTKLESQRDSNELQRTNPETKQTSIENFVL